MQSRPAWARGLKRRLRGQSGRPWQDGHPVRTLNKKGKYENEGRPLDESKAKILHKVRNYGS